MRPGRGALSSSRFRKGGKVKIGLVSDIYYPFPSAAAEINHNLYLGLQRLGHEVKVITSSYGREKVRDENILRLGRTVLVPFNGALVTITVGLSLVTQLRRLLRREKFDILHIQGPLGPTLPLLSLVLSNTTTVGTFVSYFDSSRFLATLKPFFKRYFEKLDGKIAISEAARSAISRYFPSAYRIIPIGVEVGRFTSDVRGIERYRDGKKNVLFVGRLEPRKGLIFLLKAFPLVKEEIGKVRLIVVGGGSWESFYRRRVPKAVSEDVQFEGAVPGDLLPDYYASADVFCAPATGQESFGMVLLEALASGKPVVASRIEGYREVVRDRVDGLLVEPRNPRAIADGLVLLLKDDALREEFGARGRERAISYSWEKVTEAVLNYYVECAKSGRRGGLQEIRG